jgi:Acetyltransferase (GNAT) domain
MGDIEIKSFDGNLQALSDMAHQSWFEEYGISTWPDLYKPQLSAHFFSGITDPRYLVGAYDGDRLVAFIANLPRSYRLNGRNYHGVMSCMLVGHKEYRRKHIVIDLIGECLRRNKEIGCDFALMTLESGHRSSIMLDKHFAGNNRLETLKKMYPIACPLDLDRMANSEGLKGYELAAIKALGVGRERTAPAVKGEVRPYRSHDLSAIHDMVSSYPDRGKLVRLFGQKELAAQLDTPGVTSTVVYEKEGVAAGFINFTVYDMVSPKGRNRWAWQDFLYWTGLNADEKKALIEGLKQDAREKGCIAVLEWNKNYYSKLPLFRSGYIAYPRFLKLAGWVFNPEIRLKGTSGVFEQQI